MKKILLASLFCLFQLIQADASHMMGGQITLQHVSGLDYLVKYTAYRDTTGIPISPVAMLTFVDSSTATSFTVTIPYDTTVVSLIPGVEEYVYDSVITFPSAGNWYVFYEECCRNFALLNMTNPGGESHHFYSRAMVDSVNSTPVFLNPPIVLAQENVPFYYNPLPFDADGDSISWSLDIPLSSNAAPVAGYVLPSSDSLVPFNMDPITGEITFLPNLVGNFQVSVRVQEFRNGVMIGEISRDMQIIVVGSTNRPAIVTVSSNQPPYNSKVYNLNPSTAFSMNVSIIDQDAQQISVSGVGEPFMLTSNPAALNVAYGNGNATATLSWTPNASQARTAPYVIGLRISEDFGYYVFQSDLSITLRVGNFSTGISETTFDASLQVLPNPSSGNFNVQFLSRSNADVRVTVLGLDGKKAASFMQDQIISGLNIVRVNHLNLETGVYMVILEQNGKPIGTQRVMITR